MLTIFMYGKNPGQVGMYMGKNTDATLHCCGLYSVLSNWKVRMLEQSQRETTSDQDLSSPDLLCQGLQLAWEEAFHPCPSQTLLVQFYPLEVGGWAGAKK